MQCFFFSSRFSFSKLQQFNIYCLWTLDIGHILSFIRWSVYAYTFLTLDHCFFVYYMWKSNCTMYIECESTNVVMNTNVDSIKLCLIELTSFFVDDSPPIILLFISLFQCFIFFSVCKILNAQFSIIIVFVMKILKQKAPKRTHTNELYKCRKNVAFLMNESPKFWHRIRQFGTEAKGMMKNERNN